MNKKEVLEIRKQFTPENCAITRIAGCYVDGEKEKRMEREEAFLSLPEEQAFKYFDIFKKTLSGKIGKNLLNLEYKLKESWSSDPEGEEHELLMNLRESKLRDPALLDEFYEKILTSYDCAENYYIVLSMQYMTYRERHRTEKNWKMHLTKYTISFFVASAR